MDIHPAYDMDMEMRKRKKIRVKESFFKCNCAN